MSRGWLIVFAKAPRAGLVKTRMSPPFSIDECADLYRAMLGDVLDASARFAQSADLEPIIAFHPPDAVQEMIVRAPPEFRLHEQRGEGLGERMAFAAAEALAAGAERVVIRGSDSPALPFARLEESLEKLDAGCELVLTPDQGGGYAMIGLSRVERRLFEMPMSTASVLEQTMASADALGIRTGATRSAFDLDTVGDLQLMERLSDEEKTDLCPRTVQYLSTSIAQRVL